MKRMLFAAVLLSAALPRSGVSLGQEGPPAAAPADAPQENTIEVVVEGVGADASAALADAFREAVEKALGVVIDATTKAENDELIEDKILTASNGFLSEYKRLSIKEKDGLVHVEIRARVERADLIEGLRKLKITTTAFDPKSLLAKDEEARFSDARIAEMSKEEMQASKTEILHDLLLDYPKVLEARAKIPDRFDYDSATETLKMTVRVSADNEAYFENFLKRLEQRLDKLCLQKGSTDAAAVPRDLPWLNGEKAPGFETHDVVHLSGPDLTRAPDAWCLWVLSQVMQKGAGTRWKGYLLDADVKKTLSALRGELSVNCELLDAEKKTIVERSFDLTKQASWLGFYKTRPKSHLSHSIDVPLLTPPDATLAVSQETSVNVFLAPTLFQSKWAHVSRINGGSTQIRYVLAWDQPLEVKLMPAEYERMRSIRCTVMFQAAK